MTEEKSINAEAETDAAAEDSGSKPETEKLFSQAELDRIVKERLKRQKTKYDEEAAADLKRREADLNAKEAELTARETKLLCKEYLAEKGYSKDLLEILEVSDFEAFKKKAEKVMQISAGSRHKSAPISSIYEEAPADTGAGFSRSVKHTPKKNY